MHAHKPKTAVVGTAVVIFAEVGDPLYKAHQSPTQQSLTNTDKDQERQTKSNSKQRPKKADKEQKISKKSNKAKQSNYKT